MFADLLRGRHTSIPMIRVSVLIFGAIQRQGTKKVRKFIIPLIMLSATTAHAQQAIAVGNARSSSRSSSIGALYSPTNVNRNTNSFAPRNSFSASNNVRVGGQRTTVVNNIDPSPGDPGGYQGQTIQSVNTPRQAPSVFAPSAPSGTGSCMTAITFGGSVPAGGLSFSLPWADHRCDTRANTVLISQVAGKRAAVQNLCWDDEMAQSLAAAGISCRVGRRQR